MFLVCPLSVNPALVLWRDPKKVTDRLNEIAALYDELAAGQGLGRTDRE
jgi:hypothetical protein